MKNKKVWMGIGAVVVIALVVWMCSGGKKEQKAEFSTAKVEKQNISTSITATGTIEPVTSVTVGTQVSGIVSKLYVDYNSIVKKGQIIAELDKTNLISELNRAKADLSSAQSTLNYETANYNRYKTLFDKGLISANDYENARLSFDKAQQTVRSSRENVQKAQTNLGYATITSPIDGVVLSKSVEEGQTVAASFNTPELFTIAQDLTDMRVIADIDEADIGGVKEGQRVSFTVDAYPDDKFEGQVTQVRQQATTESNVVTYEVVISAPNNDLKLKPGSPHLPRHCDSCLPRPCSQKVRALRMSKRPRRYGRWRVTSSRLILCRWELPTACLLRLSVASTKAPRCLSTSH